MKITVRSHCSEAYHAEKDGKEFQVGLRFEDGTATYPKKCTVIIDGEEETVDIGEGDDRIKKAVKAGAEKLGYKIVESKKSESETSSAEQAFKNAADTCGVSDKITITTNGDKVYCIMEMDEDKYGIGHYKWGFDTTTNNLEWYGDESTSGVGAKKKFDNFNDLKSWLIKDIKALFKTHRYESKDLSGYTSDFIKDFRARMESMIGEPYDEDDILGYGWVWKSEDIGYPNGNKTYYEYFSLSDDGVPYTMEIGYNSSNETISSFKMWQEASEKKSESREGWDDWEEIEGLEESIDGIEKLAYELRHCIRGAYTRCKTWAELSKYVVRLADALRSAGEDLKYKQDESKKPKSDANEDKRDLEALRARFCDNPECAKIGRLSSPYDDIAVYGTQTWSDGVPVMKCWYRDNKKIPVTLKKGTHCIVMLDSKYGEEVESVWIPYRSGWLRVDGDDIEVDY